MNTQVKPESESKRLADLIASVMTGEGQPAAQATVDAEVVREAREHLLAERPSHHDLATVDFQRLDVESDWTDV
jgi:hypothetical protein